MGRQNTHIRLKGERVDLVGLGDVLVGGEILEVLGDIKPADCLARQREDMIDVMTLRAI